MENAQQVRQHQELSRRREDEAEARRRRAASFAARWQDKGEAEVGDKGSFWDELLADVFGVQNPRSSGFIEYEKTVESPTVQGKIDGYIPSTRVIIEQKSSKHSLNDRTLHGGRRKTPFQQAWDYGTALPDRPNWIVACNFKEFWIWDTRHLDQGYTVVTLEKLSKQWEDLAFLVDASATAITRREELNVDAALLVDALYDALKLCYPLEERETESTAQALNVLCVRLVFCFYAESARLFGKRNIFRDYLGLYSSEVRTTADFEYLRVSLLELFRALDKTDDERAADKDLRHLDRIKDFPYVNGGLFTAESDIPVFDAGVIAALENCEKFNWEGINPTIFGAVFESTIESKARRSGGMHYTSIENIHKVIRPLFLDELEAKLSVIKAHNVASEREKRLASFIEELGKLTFLDPACGSGNFLTETYIQLCRLEGEAVEAILETAVALSFVYEGPSIDHFYGIEVDDFASSVAKTAMWIADCQMKRNLRAITHAGAATFPITAEAHIFKGNALALDWSTMKDQDNKSAAEPLKNREPQDKQLVFSFDAVESVEQLEAMQQKLEEAKQALLQRKEEVAHYRYDYIMGNPPFAGRRYRTSEQIKDVAQFFSFKDIDYVACWYKKATDFIQGTTTRCAFVSTNSITQGEQVVALWKPLFDAGVHIDFAYRTFKWQSESTDMAHVFCVIVGFSVAENSKPKVIYEGEGDAITGKEVSHINGYLTDAPDVFIRTRTKPICDAPEMKNGNVPLDGDALKIEAEDYNEFKSCAKYVKRLMGGRELLNNEKRYVLWLVGVPPDVIKKNPKIYNRVKLCKERRLAMKDKATQKLAKTPTTFRDTNNPARYIALPLVSSANRFYVPIAYLDGSVIPTNQIQTIPNATLYHLGVLTSSVHMAWMRAVCGRLGMGYRYSKDVVYNNFVWPEATDQQRAAIEQTAQAILTAREAYPDSSLAALYDETTMPPDLRRAHEANDRAVLTAYGWAEDTTESDIVARLMELYQAKAGDDAG